MMKRKEAGVCAWRLPLISLPSVLLLVLVIPCCLLMMITPAQATDLSGIITAFSRDATPLAQPCPALCSCSTRIAHNVLQDRLGHYLQQPSVAAIDPELEEKLRNTVGIMTSWLGSMALMQCRLPHSTDRLSLSSALRSSTLSFKAISVVCESGGTVVWDLPLVYSFLNVLHISGCALQTPVRDQALLVPSKLWVLELQAVPTDAIASLNFSQASQLLMLSLTHSDLPSLPDHWSQHVLSTLWFLSLTHNNLSSFDCQLKAPQLQSISLDYNDLLALPQCLLDGSKYSSHISLRHNQISSLQELTTSKLESQQQQALPHITYLDLAHNQLDSLRALKKMPSLLGLDLSHNHLSFAASDSFFWNPQLQWLDISNNFLEHIEDALLGSLARLKHLNLSHNSLQAFDFDHEVISTALETIDLRHNSLIYPPFATLSYATPSWLHLRAGQNPYLCDCNIYPFLQRQNKLKKEASTIWVTLRRLYSFSVKAFSIFPYEDLEDFCCDGPGQLKGVPLIAVDFGKVCPLPRGCPDDCRCKLVKESPPYIAVNCSSAASLTELPDGLPFVANAYLKLFLNQTGIRRLDYRPYLHRVRELYAGQSKVSTVTSDALKALENVSVLDLHDSKLRSLPAVAQHLTLPNVTLLDLTGNPWTCGCRDLWMSGWMNRHNAVVTDNNEVRCHWTGRLVAQLSPADLNCGFLDYLPLTIFLSLAAGLLVIMSSFLSRFKLEMLVFIYRHSGLRPMDMFVYDDSQPYLFDVFVTFSEEDEPWVEENLLASLERKALRTPYRLCTLRDFPPGTPVEDSVAWAADNSMCTLMILSRHMIDNEWRNPSGCFRAAHLRLLQDHPEKLLILIHGPLDARLLDTELKEYLRLGGCGAYLKSNEAWFWPKLDYALPRPQGMVFPNLADAGLEEQAYAACTANKPRRARGARGGGGGGGGGGTETVATAAVSEMGGSLAAGDVTEHKAEQASSGDSGCALSGQ